MADGVCEMFKNVLGGHILKSTTKMDVRSIFCERAGRGRWRLSSGDISTFAFAFCDIGKCRLGMERVKLGSGWVTVTDWGSTRSQYWMGLDRCDSALYEIPNYFPFPSFAFIVNLSLPLPNSFAAAR
jgi:hypothetical protein